MIPLVILTILSILFVLIHKYLTQKYCYWKKKCVPHLKPLPILGNYGEYILLKQYIGIVNQKICLSYPKEPYVGSYYGTEPALIIQCPELIKLVTTKDFYFFSSREISKYTHNEVFTQNMFFTYGDRWKVMRQNFSPLFSSAKMKNMFYLIEKCCHDLKDLLTEETKTSQVVEIRSIVARYTIDCIGSCVFGVDTNAMGKSDNHFRKMGEVIFEISNLRGFFLIARAIWPALFYGLGLKTFPKAMNVFFHNLLTGVFKARNYAASTRNDFVDLVLSMAKNKYITGDRLSNLKTQKDEKTRLKVNDDLLVANCLSFFAAGFETSATTLSFTLYELAKDQAAQSRAADEVRRYLGKGEGLKYDCVTELPYLEACIDEALRLYPVLGVITREVVEEYTLPSGLRLEPGLRIHLPVYHLHRCAEYFPEPQKFMPERFLPENRRNIQPYTYLPFGEGPRICIGMRFAKMQMLAGLVSVLAGHQVQLAGDMPRELRLEPRGLVTQPDQGIYLTLVRRECPLGHL
ncbi:cytochrome P450 6k1-like [Pectinophora gossypiella]|uniref:cytochrome P450 6k1-like n=1 Tax=Pectinophora gossypiella TaxID=13191 RepID=UPI00214E4FB1|nr:cytochrome P450 6k1-like [Pectinophora gossypiella]